MLAPRRALADRLGDPDEVALAVEEERAQLAGALARVVVGGGDRVAAGPEARHLVALEGHTPGPQIGHRRLEVLDLECHLGRRSRWCPRRAEEMELGWSAHVAQPARALLDRLEPELVAVEGACSLEVLSGGLGYG